MLAAFIVTIVATVATVTVTEQPAAAAGVCPSGYACFYEHTGYNGSSTLYSTAFRGQCVTFFGFWHDRISSLKSNLGSGMTLYSNGYCDGSGGYMYWGGGNIGDMWAYGMNDSIDSVYFYY